MNKMYYSLLTDIGIREMTAASVADKKVTLSHMVIGDGNGTVYQPTGKETALKHEVYRAPLASLRVQENRLIADAVIPYDASGFTVREIGLLDQTGQLIAVGNFPDVPKDSSADGALGELHITITVQASNSEVFDVLINPDGACTIHMLQQVAADLDKHAKRTDNPHSVTAENVGLGNVQNTADSDKEVKSAREIRDANKGDNTYLIYDSEGASGTKKSISFLDVQNNKAIPVKESVIGGKGTTRVLANNDFLSIDTTGDFASEDMKPSVFGSNTADTSYTNCPSGIKGPFYGFREVFKAKHLITVQLTEAYPQAGRTWLNTYDTSTSSWYGWQENGGAWPTSKMGNMPPFKNEAAAGAKVYYLGFNGGQDPVQAVPAAKMTARANNISMGYDGNLHISYS